MILQLFDVEFNSFLGHGDSIIHIFSIGDASWCRAAMRLPEGFFAFFFYQPHAAMRRRHLRSGFSAKNIMPLCGDSIYSLDFSAKNIMPRCGEGLSLLHLPAVLRFTAGWLLTPRCLHAWGQDFLTQKIVVMNLLQFSPIKVLLCLVLSRGVMFSSITACHPTAIGSKARR